MPSSPAVLGGNPARCGPWPSLRHANPIASGHSLPPRHRGSDGSCLAPLGPERKKALLEREAGRTEPEPPYNGPSPWGNLGDPAMPRSRPCGDLLIKAGNPEMGGLSGC